MIAIAEQHVKKSVADPDWRKRPRKRSGFNSPEGYVRERELANMLGVTPRTVRRWDSMREGPPRIKISKQVFYRIEAVHQWLRANEKQPLRRPKKGGVSKQRENPACEAGQHSKGGNSI